MGYRVDRETYKNFAAMPKKNTTEMYRIAAPRTDRCLCQWPGV